MSKPLSGFQWWRNRDSQTRRSRSDRCMKTERVFQKIIGWQHIDITKPLITQWTWAVLDRVLTALPCYMRMDIQPRRTMFLSTWLMRLDETLTECKTWHRR